MATIEVEIKDDAKVDFIKQLLKEYGLQEVESNVFEDDKRKEKDKKSPPKDKSNENTEG